MKTITFFLTISICVSAFSQVQETTIGTDRAEVNVSTSKEGEFAGRRAPLISPYYRKGSNLIFDCEDQHFACVDDESYKKCEDWRHKAIDLVEDFMPCAPLKKFKTDEECSKIHYKRIYSQASKKFCIRTRKKN